MIFLRRIFVGVAVMALLAPSAARAQPGGTIRVRHVGPVTSTRDVVDPNSGSGGRINRLSVSRTRPSFIYAASEYGGLFFSDDGGDTWRIDHDHVPVKAWDVAIDPSNERLVVATSHYDGRRSSLSGIRVRRPPIGAPITGADASDYRWRKAPTATPPAGYDCDDVRKEEPSAFGVAFDEDSPQRIFVGTNCGLAISEDSGSTWRYVDPTPSDPASDIWDVIVHNGVTIDVCGDDGHHRSTDGGVTFATAGAGAPPLPSGVCTLAVSPDESYVLFASVGTTLWESDDGGASWQPGPMPAGRRFGRIPFVLTNQRAGDGFDLWFGDVGLYRMSCTTPSPAVPGGAPRCRSAWSPSFTKRAGAHDDVGDLTFETTVTTDACPTLFASDGGVYVNTLATSPSCHSPAWEQPARTPQALWLWDLDGADRTRPTQEDLYLATQDNGPFATQEAPASAPAWVSDQCCDTFDVEAGPTGLLYTFCCFAPPSSVRLFRDDRTLSDAVPVTPLPGRLIGFQDMDTVQATSQGTVVVTASGATFLAASVATNPVTWTALGAATVPAGLCSIEASRLPAAPGRPADGLVLVGKGGLCTHRQTGTLWRYASRTDRWTRIAEPGSAPGDVGIFAVDPGDADHIIASFVSSARMMETRDGGTSWLAMPELDRKMTGDGAFRAQVRRGRFGFNRWGAYPQPVLVEFDPSDPRRVVAGGVDSGVFVRPAAAGIAGWIELRDSRFPQRTIARPQSVYFDSNAAFGRVVVYVGTRGRGVVRAEVELLP